MEGGGIRVRAESGRPRLTLLDQMSAITADGRELAGLTLDDILSAQKRAAPASDATPAPAPAPPPSEPPGRTLLDIIRDEDPMAGSCKSFAAANRDRRSWRSFKDRLRLKRSGSGAAWTSSVHVPTSDILIPTSRSMVSRRNSVGSLFAESPQEAAHPDDASAAAPQGFRLQISRRSSCRFGTNTSFASDPTRSFDNNSAGNDDVVSDANSSGSSPIRRPSLSHAPSLRHQISRRHSTRFSPAMDDGGLSDLTEPLPPQREGSRRLSAVLAEERSLSAREAVAAQEAAEAASAAAAAAAAAEESETDSPAAATEAAPAVRMSLMDLLEETDRQMGLVGSRYMFDDDEDYDEEEEEELGSGAGAVAVAGAEQNCCVCMVRHKGAAFIPCGHTFCRLCSRELWVSRGNCPLCNGFILEILDIF